MARKLASIQKIIDVFPIEKADNIELVTILGWHLIAKKGEFKKDDLAVFFEIDSILPEKEWSEFLRDKKFRIKTMKLNKFKVVSQGLALPISLIPELKDVSICEDKDVTEILGIVKYDDYHEERPYKVFDNNNKKNKFVEFMRRYEWFQKLYIKLYGRVPKGWPQFIKKTDETRIQSSPILLKMLAGKRMYISEKMDGSSFTAFVKKNLEKSWLFKKKLYFGVCSRNIWLKKRNNSHFWQGAEFYDVEHKLKMAANNLGIDIAIQGELCHPSIQENRYEFTNYKLFIFNVIDLTNNKSFTYSELINFCKTYGFETVPILDDNFYITENTTVDDLVKLASAKSIHNQNCWREGIVIRDVDNPIQNSFKVISIEYLLEKKD